MKTIFIFELSNKCKEALAGPAPFDFIAQRYDVFRHPRVVKKSICLGSRQRFPLNNSKDDGIFISTIPVINFHKISGVVTNTLNGLNQSNYNGVCGEGCEYRELCDLFLPLDLNDSDERPTTKNLRKKGLLNLRGFRGLIFSFTPETSLPLTGSCYLANFIL